VDATDQWNNEEEKKRMERRRTLRIGQELILINDRRDRHLVGGTTTFKPYHPTLASHPNAFCKRDFGREG
jgi:hypothetical protein